MSEAVADASNVSWHEVRQVLEEEMARLPDDLRSAVVVCLFEGHTQEEAGQILNVHPRTVKDRVRRGRELLRSRLTPPRDHTGRHGHLALGRDGRGVGPRSPPDGDAQGRGGRRQQDHPGGYCVALRAGAGGLDGAAGAWVVIAALALALAASSIAGYVAWERVGTRPRPMQSVTESFRGGRFNRDLLKWSGPTPQRFFRLEPEGLRMTLPSQDGPAQPLGIALRPAVRGDFELEATFELLTIAQPENEGSRGSPSTSSWTTRNGTVCGLAK